MTDPDITAIAAHLHVLLRRRAGRVTDIEWMAVNSEYALAVADFAKHKADELKAEDLELWATKLEVAVMRRKAPQKPLVQTVVETIADSRPKATRVLAPDEPPGAEVSSDTSRYIGTLR